MTHTIPSVSKRLVKNKQQSQRRLMIVGCITLMTLLGAALYHIKYEVMDLEDKLAATKSEVQKEQESLRILQAEWQYLANPSALEVHAENMDEYETIRPSRVVTLDMLGDLDPTTGTGSRHRMLVKY